MQWNPVDGDSLNQLKQATSSAVQKHSSTWHLMPGDAPGFIRMAWAVGVGTVTTQGA